MNRPPVEVPATLLIVDDTPQSLTVLGEILAGAYRVRVATSGRQALALANSDPFPDLILLDVTMPDMDGYAVLAELRSCEATRDIPVIFVTARDSTEDEQRGFDLGAADYIVKPFSVPIVLARVHMQLELKRTRDRLRAQNRALEAEVEERRRSEAEVRKLNEALQRSVAQLESFTYTVSHDLRAPLRTMNGFAQLLRMDVEAGDLDRIPAHVERISTNTDRMASLIDGLLAVARCAHADLKYERIDMAALVQQILAEHVETSRAFISLGTLPVIKADRATMRQVWTNLLSNALKYSARQSQPEVSVRCDFEGDEAVFSVTDNGVGFSNEFSGKLFNVFQRLHSSSEFEGNGIGLAIVRTIVELHGGRVWATGHPGAGATFYIALPGALAIKD